jgi:hypothetical protein
MKFKKKCHIGGISAQERGGLYLWTLQVAVASGSGKPWEDHPSDGVETHLNDILTIYRPHFKALVIYCSLR